MELEKFYTYIDKYQLDKELLENNKELISNISLKNKIDKETRKKFPKFPSSERKNYSENEIDRIVRGVIIYLYINKKIDDYLEQTKKRTNKVEKNVRDGNKSELVKTISNERNIKYEEAKEYVLSSINRFNSEMSETEDAIQSEYFEERDIDENGLSLFDSIKCLRDFEGRTFPFLKGIIEEKDKKRTAIELGSGTGILSFYSAISGFDKVYGIEINPLSYILSEIIRKNLEEKNMIPKNTVSILPSDVMKIGAVEHQYLTNEEVDLVISENIYTGMLYENQIKLICSACENGIVETSKDNHSVFRGYNIQSDIIPRGVSSSIELTEVKNKPDYPSIPLIEYGEDKLEKTLSDEVLYDQIKFSEKEPRNIKSIMRIKCKKEGTVNSINITSRVKISDRTFIDRNQTEFFNDNHLLFLNKGIEVKEGDEIILCILYNEGDDHRNIIVELRKVKPDGSIPEDYDSRINVRKRTHNENIIKFKENNKIRTNINKKDIGIGVKVKSSSYYGGVNHQWLMNMID
jgi:predicted RNA methylase